MTTGQQGKNIGISRVLANTDVRWKRAFRLYVYYLPAGWTNLGEVIRFDLEAMPDVNKWFHKEQSWGGMVSAAIKEGVLEQLDRWGYPIDTPSHASAKRILRRTRLRYGNANGNKGRLPVTFDLGERIKQVRAVEEKIKAMEAAFDATLKPYEEFAEAGRVEILEFLNATNQKSANTQYGTAYWKTKVTYRVQDKSEFQAHVIGAEAWELVTWGAAGTAAEAFTEEHGEPPPGCARNAVNILYINAPAKPRTKVAKASEAEPDDEDKSAPDLAAE